MPDRDGYMPGVPCWIDATMPDPQAAATFYSSLFGWEFENDMPPSAPGEYLVTRLRGDDVAAIAPPPTEAPQSAVWNTYIWVDSADDAASRALAAGGRVLAEPFDAMSANRMARIADPEGAAFCVWEAREHRGARIVNEPGSLNFNGLNTRDPARARSFYGALFGWETLTLGGDAEAWRLPRYGDFLERSDPELRQRMAQIDAPHGFEDVVATLNPITAEQPHVPAHWSVTFAVTDADATAARAVELGGELLVAPFDAPWVRMAVIADPQGATFIASKFAPENRAR